MLSSTDSFALLSPDPETHSLTTSTIHKSSILVCIFFILVCICSILVCICYLSASLSLWHIHFLSSLGLDPGEYRYGVSLWTGRHRRMMHSKRKAHDTLCPKVNYNNKSEEGGRKSILLRGSGWVKLGCCCRLRSIGSFSFSFVAFSSHEFYFATDLMEYIYIFCME